MYLPPNPESAYNDTTLKSPLEPASRYLLAVGKGRAMSKCSNRHFALSVSTEMISIDPNHNLCYNVAMLKDRTRYGRTE